MLVLKGIILDIQKCSYHDGPGIRTAVFLKGCNLRCEWCHNPESFLAAPQMRYNSKKCISCGECCKICKSNAHEVQDSTHRLNFTKCKNCLKCVNVCPSAALTKHGCEMTAHQVLAEVMRDEHFYAASGGGVTFTGGEPTMQYDFLQELLHLSKQNGLHVCVETNGAIPFERLEDLLPCIDVLLLDYKATDDGVHFRYTGVSNKQIMQNLQKLNSLKVPVYLRAPIVPKINDNDEHLAAIKALREKYSNIVSAQIMPYHNLGATKWAEIGLEYKLLSTPSASEEQKKEWQTKIL